MALPWHPGGRLALSSLYSCFLSSFLKGTHQSSPTPDLGLCAGCPCYLNHSCFTLCIAREVSMAFQTCRDASEELSSLSFPSETLLFVCIHTHMQIHALMQSTHACKHTYMYTWGFLMTGSLPYPTSSLSHQISLPPAVFNHCFRVNLLMQI